MNDFHTKLKETADRIREMREIFGYSEAEMAQKTDVSKEAYCAYESGELDFPFTFLHKCALVFGIGIMDILEGHSAHLSNYTVNRAGEGQVAVDEDGIRIVNLASMFKNKIAEPHWVRYTYRPELQDKPIHTSTHSGQEFDFIISGKLKVQVGQHTEVLGAGDSIYYDSGTPHGMIAVDGEDCVFCAVVLPGEETDEVDTAHTIAGVRPRTRLLCEKFVHTTEDEKGALKAVSFENTDTYNFGFDTVDAIADAYPDKLAMIHVDKNHTERRFTFKDIKRESARAANYFASLGIKKGDKVMLVLKRHYQFWFAIVGLHKLGAIAIPATEQLMAHDFVYRFESANVSAIVCTADGQVCAEAEKAMAEYNAPLTRIVVGKGREGWHNFDEEFARFSSHFARTADTPAGDEPALMFFSSGTTGYPKIVSHSNKYALGHYITARYWHCVDRDGLHLTISGTGWGKALWGKLYGQWLCEGAVFVYDFDRFDAADIMPMFAKYQITTFCAPPTMLRMFIKEDLSRYDLSSVRHMTTAGEALNPEVYRRFEEATGLQIMEGFGQTETTLAIATLVGTAPRVGSMGKASPLYDICLLDKQGQKVGAGETGEIAICTKDAVPCGLFLGYGDKEKTDAAWHDGYYHTGDLAWQDEDGYFFYVGRADDVIKSSGYRIGPFEIESVIMELPYVLECGVSAAPDEIRGQVVKASIVLTKGTEGTDALKKEIQEYVKHRTAPYKYPRIIVFKDELPKTISGKIQRNKL